MEENSKSLEETKELTPEELNEVAGGGISMPPSEPTTEGHTGWIEINSFQWGGE